MQCACALTGECVPGEAAGEGISTDIFAYSVITGIQPDTNSAVMIISGQRIKTGGSFLKAISYRRSRLELSLETETVPELLLRCTRIWERTP